MDIFNRSPLQQLFTRAITWGLTGAGLSLTTLLLWQSFTFPKTASERLVAIGSLELMRITRTPIGEGQVGVGFTWLPGLIWYAVSWILLSLLIGLIVQKRTENKQ